MSNKVAVVTGANKGLGFALVKELCEQFDGTVYLTSRDQTRGLDACNQLENIGLKPFYHQLDVTDTHSVNKFCHYVKKTHGKIDLLINNAGILFLKSPEPKSYQAEQTILVNFFSLVNFTEELLPLISNGGVIVNISSSSGHLSRIPSQDLRNKFMKEDLTLEELKGLMSKYVDAAKEGRDASEGWGDSPYVVSKVGVNAYTLIMLHRRLMDRGISVNCVHPGYVQSDMTFGSGNISPADAAKVPAALALRPPGSGLYVWSNGSVVSWDGQDPRVFIDGRAPS